MKNLTKSIAIAVISTLSFNSIANNGALKPTVKTNTTFQVGMYQQANSAKMNLLVKMDRSQKVQILLKNSAGDILYAEKISKTGNGYARKFDFNEMEDGQYSFEITNGIAKEVKTIKIDSKKIETTKVISFN